jgi:hypothetical protein
MMLLTHCSARVKVFSTPARAKGFAFLLDVAPAIVWEDDEVIPTV